VGGASRGERRRRQAAQRPAGPSPRPPTGTPPRRDNRVKVGVLATVVIIAVFAVVYVVLNRPWGTQQQAAASYPVAVDGVVVTAGPASAPVTIDVYEDYLCPYCERFETRYGDDLTTALNEGKVKVNYHALNILDAGTTPPGYSTLAANAALCAVPAGIWSAFHQRLFADQPAEGSAGLTAAQLSAIGTELGAGPGFTSCVEANGNAAAVSAATEAASTNPALQTDGQFGTPTIAVGGRKVDVSDTGWLQKALGG
jgi:protein-disulfide isomerase